MVGPSAAARASSAYSGQAWDSSDIFICCYRFAPANAEDLTIAFNAVEVCATYVYAASFRIHTCIHIGRTFEDLHNKAWSTTNIIT